MVLEAEFSASSRPILATLAVMSVEQDMERLLEAMTQVLVPPFQVVQNVVNYEWTFPIAHSPSEVESDEEPPIRLGERVDMIPIDGLLGLYTPATQQITIFRKGVHRIAEILMLRERDLTFVVRLHEWSRALLHVGLPEADRIQVTADDSSWPLYLAQATSVFEGIDSELHERLAQLLTFHGLQITRTAATNLKAKAALGRITDTFTKLTQRSPREYQIDEYVEAPKDRIVKSIELLKSRSLIGLYAWETVVKW